MGRQLATDMKSSAQKTVSGVSHSAPVPSAITGHKEFKEGKPGGSAASLASGRIESDLLLEAYRKRRKQGSTQSWNEMMHGTAPAPATSSSVRRIDSSLLPTQHQATADLRRSLSDALRRYDSEKHSFLRDNPPAAIFSVNYLSAEAETLSLQDIPR